jgi:hypothetical protein
MAVETPMSRMLIIGAAVATTLLAGCGATTGSGTVLSSPTPSPVPVTVVTPAPTAAPTVAPGNPMGTTVTTTTNATFTVSLYGNGHSSNQFETPPPGGHFATVHIKECAGDSSQFVSMLGWSVLLADQTQIDSTLLVDGSPAPGLPTSNLNPGACTSGYVYFPIPNSPPMIEIRPTNSDFFWTVP